MDSKTLTHILLSKNYHVFVATRRNTTFEIDNLKTIFQDDLGKYPESKFSTLYVDVTDSGSIRNCIEKILAETGGINEIYHLAAASHVMYSYEAPFLNIETNAVSVLHFLDIVRQITPKTKFYFAASTEMFAGNVDDGKYNEESNFYPKTVYGCSKILGFNLTRYFRETYGVFAVSGILANHSNIYRHNSFFIRKLTQTAARIALGKTNELRIGHLKWARDEFYSDFGMEAAYNMLQLEKPVDLVIGNGKTKWGEEYVQLAFDFFNLKWRDYVVFDKKFLRLNEVVKLEVSCEKAEKLLNWKTNRMSFKQHIEIMCENDLQLEKGKIIERVNVLEMFPV